MFVCGDFAHHIELTLVVILSADSIKCCLTSKGIHIVEIKSSDDSVIYKMEFPITLKHQETQGDVISTVATDALVLKHEAISIHNAD